MMLLKRDKHSIANKIWDNANYFATALAKVYKLAIPSGLNIHKLIFLYCPLDKLMYVGGWYTSFKYLHTSSN